MRRIACGLIAAFAASTVAYAADDLVPAPKGAPLLLAVDADGVQIYACEPKDQVFAWAFKAPEANKGEQARIRYYALYQFFGVAKQRR